MMTYIIGQERCIYCGAICMVILRTSARDAQAVLTGRVRECDECGHLASRVDVWFPCAYWPEVEALVQFDDVRQKLKLPPLTEERFH